MRPTDVVVVGGGASGLAAAAALKQLGVEPVVFERDSRLAGTWARRYERLHLHTVRRFSGLPYHSIPRSQPRYVSKDAYADYLREYAERAGIDVRLNRGVERISPAWTLQTGEGAVEARAVVVATGRHNRPQIPAWPGRERYGGRLLHSVDYRSGREFAGRRALVVGIGNSGSEIAADLAEQGAERVVIAVRTPPPIVRREMFGVPVQLFGMLLAPLPPRLVDRVAAAARRVGTGDLRRYGLAPAAWGPFTARRPPVIDVGFLRELKAGRIEVAGDVERLTETGVVFAGGRSEDFDVVVAATGFSTGLATLVDAPGALDERGHPAGSEPQPGLFFMGYTETPRGQLFEASRQAPRVARAVVRHLALTA